jgi:16S rRNA (cytidine1402-2'-O)-methyltransferase
VSTIVSIFGVPENSHHFWGFFPQKRKKQKALCEWFSSVPGVHVFFESPFRILKTLALVVVEDIPYHVVVGRELTKQFETIVRGSPAEVLQAVETGTVKGEFTVALCRRESPSDESAED